MCAKAGLRSDGATDIHEDHFGMYVKASPPKDDPHGTHAKLSALRRKGSRNLAWVGYERSENNGLLAVVYFYCSARSASRLARDLSAKFKSNFKRWGRDLAVYKDPDSREDDAKWFNAVFQMLEKLSQTRMATKRKSTIYHAIRS